MINNTPKYFAKLHTFRHKIVGDADSALEAYNTLLEWTQFLKCLIMHYSDKSNIHRPLEYQLTDLRQRHEDIPTLYQNLPLILDKIACHDQSDESIRTMTNSYREKGLSPFIGGLNDLPSLLSMRESTTLP